MRDRPPLAGARPRTASRSLGSAERDSGRRQECTPKILPVLACGRGPACPAPAIRRHSFALNRGFQQRWWRHLKATGERHSGDRSGQPHSRPGTITPLSSLSQARIQFSSMLGRIGVRAFLPFWSQVGVEGGSHMAGFASSFSQLVIAVLCIGAAPAVSHALGSDVTAPVTTNDSDGLWHNSPVTVTLSATHSESGPQTTYWSIDGATPPSSGGTLVGDALATRLSRPTSPRPPIIPQTVRTREVPVGRCRKQHRDTAVLFGQDRHSGSDHHAERCRQGLVQRGGSPCPFAMRRLSKSRSTWHSVDGVAAPGTSFTVPAADGAHAVLYWVA